MGDRLVTIKRLISKNVTPTKKKFVKSINGFRMVLKNNERSDTTSLV